MEIKTFLACFPFPNVATVVIPHAAQHMQLLFGMFSFPYDGNHGHTPCSPTHATRDLSKDMLNGRVWRTARPASAHASMAVTMCACSCALSSPLCSSRPWTTFTVWGAPLMRTVSSKKKSFLLRICAATECLLSQVYPTAVKRINDCSFSGHWLCTEPTGIPFQNGISYMKYQHSSPRKSKTCLALWRCTQPMHKMPPLMRYTLRDPCNTGHTSTAATWEPHLSDSVLE